MCVCKARGDDVCVNENPRERTRRCVLSLSASPTSLSFLLQRFLPLIAAGAIFPDDHEEIGPRLYPLILTLCRNACYLQVKSGTNVSDEIFNTSV